MFNLFYSVRVNLNSIWRPNSVIWGPRSANIIWWLVTIICGVTSMIVKGQFFTGPGMTIPGLRIHLINTSWILPSPSFFWNDHTVGRHVTHWHSCHMALVVMWHSNYSIKKDIERLPKHYGHLKKRIRVGKLIFHLLCNFQWLSAFLDHYFRQ